MIIILVMVMKCESYVFDLVNSWWCWITCLYSWMMIVINWNDYVRIYGNVVWTCIFQNVKGDVILLDEMKWDNEFCANFPNRNGDICWWVLLC